MNNNITALTKLKILTFCSVKPRKWGEIEKHTGKASSTLSVHINDLVISKMLYACNHKYQTTKKGKQINISIKQLENFNKLLKKFSKIQNRHGVEQ